MSDIPALPGITLSLTVSEGALTSLARLHEAENAREEARRDGERREREARVHEDRRDAALAREVAAAREAVAQERADARQNNLAAHLLKEHEENRALQRSVATSIIDLVKAFAVKTLETPTRSPGEHEPDDEGHCPECGDPPEGDLDEFDLRSPGPTAAGFKSPFDTWTAEEIERARRAAAEAAGRPDPEPGDGEPSDDSIIDAVPGAE